MYTYLKNKHKMQIWQIMKCNMTILVKNLLYQVPKEACVVRKTHIYDISHNQSLSSLAKW